MASPPAATAIGGTTSYARVMDNKEVKQQVDSVAEPIQHNYQSLIKQLRNQNAVGVVVAVGGQIVWADIFASTNLLEKYWPKLVRSYAAEAVVNKTQGYKADTKKAQEFLNQLQGGEETGGNEPRLYPPTENLGEGFRGVELTPPFPKNRFHLPIA